MLERPENFSEVFGQKAAVHYLDSRIKSGNLPQFIIFAGEEGLGKTTLAKICAVLLACPNHCGICAHCVENIEMVIRKNKDTNNIRSYAMSVDGGKETVKDLLANYTTNFVETGARVLVADEVQNMSKPAYDALLNDTEYPPKNVYLFMCTTDLEAIPKTLRSRATIIRLGRLSSIEMKEVMTNYMFTHGQSMENSDIALNIISTYAENKPRQALKVLESIGPNRKISLAEIKEYVQFEEPTVFLPLVECLNGSFLDGVTHCLNLEVKDTTQAQLCDFLQECIRSHRGETVVKYDFRLIRSILSKTNLDNLILLLYNIANVTNLNSSSLLAAYLRSHPGFDNIRNKNPEVLTQERQRQAGIDQPIQPKSNAQAPAMADILRNAKKLTE